MWKKVTIFKLYIITIDTTKKSKKNISIPSNILAVRGINSSKEDYPFKMYKVEKLLNKLRHISVHLSKFHY